MIRDDALPALHFIHSYFMCTLENQFHVEKIKRNEHVCCMDGKMGVLCVVLRSGMIGNDFGTASPFELE